jgi:hypothetical protein
VLISSSLKSEIESPIIPKISLKITAAALDNAIKTSKFNKKKLKNM